MKKPWLSALLNFLFAGTGYIYNGKRKTFGILLFIGYLILTYAELEVKEHSPTLFPVLAIAVTIIYIALAFDAYREAKTINS